MLSEGENIAHQGGVVLALVDVFLPLCKSGAHSLIGRELSSERGAHVCGRHRRVRHVLVAHSIITVAWISRVVAHVVSWLHRGRKRWAVH